MTVPGKSQSRELGIRTMRQTRGIIIKTWAFGAGFVLVSVSLSGALGPTRMGNDKRKVEGQ